MGYTTEFTGQVSIDPPLNGPEMDYLRRFAQSRRFDRRSGPYQTGTDGNRDTDTIDYNGYAVGQPSLWCDWEPTVDGTGIGWNGTEKFHDAEVWMAYIIDTFLKPDAALQAEMEDPSAWFFDPAFRHFTFNHIVNGRIEAQGEDADDRWTLAVVDNVVSKVEYPTLTERMSTDVTLAAAFETLKANGVTVEQFAKATGQDY